MLINRCLQTAEDAHRLRSRIERGSNIHFRHGIDTEIYAGDVARGVTNISRDKAEKALSIASKCSPRVVGRYLESLSKKAEKEISLIEDYSNRSDMEQLIFPYELLSFSGIPERKIEQVSGIDALAELKSHGQVGFLNYDCERGKQALNLLKSVDGRFGDFFDQQLDLPGVNSLIRHGLVKAFRLPDNSVAVAKKSNPEKPGRLELDIRNANEIYSRIARPGQAWSPIGKTKSGKTIETKIIRPIAVVSDPAKRTMYSISDLHPDPTIEEALTRNNAPRQEILEASRTLLETLYKQGIIWGDMAPRNILVNVSDSSVRLALLDFEKARLLDRPINKDERIEHARGPMCVEEFGAVCDREEVAKTFAPYFSPSSWSTDSKEVVAFAKPKREIVDILHGRGNTSFNFRVPSLGVPTITVRPFAC